MSFPRGLLAGFVALGLKLLLQDRSLEDRRRRRHELAAAHRLHAIAMERFADPKVADWESFWASLTFEIQGGR